MFKYKYNKIKLILSNGQSLTDYSPFFFKSFNIKLNYFDSHSLNKSSLKVKNIKKYKQISNIIQKVLPTNN